MRLIRPNDPVELLIADSINDGIRDDLGEYGEEWSTLHAEQTLPTAFPDDAIYDRNFVKLAQAYTGYRRVAAGTGRRTFSIIAAAAGSQPGYGMAGRFDLMYGWLEHIARIIWAHGANMAVTGDASLLLRADRGYLRLGELMDSADTMRLRYPAAQHLYIKPYPFPDDARIAPVVEAHDLLATVFPDARFIDGYTPFLADPEDGLLSDDVHPGQGRADDLLALIQPEYLDWIADLVTAAPPRPALISAPRIAQSAALNVNPLLEVDGAGAVTGWTKTGNGTAVPDYTIADTEKGQTSSLKISRGASGATYLSQNINAVPWRGLHAIIATRMYLPTGTTDNLAGRLAWSGDGTGVAANWNYDQNSQATGAFRWVYHVTPEVPADATFIQPRLYGGNESGAAAYFGRAVVVGGILPRDVIS